VQAKRSKVHNKRGQETDSNKAKSRNTGAGASSKSAPDAEKQKKQTGDKTKEATSKPKAEKKANRKKKKDVSSSDTSDSSNSSSSATSQDSDSDSSPASSSASSQSDKTVGKKRKRGRKSKQNSIWDRLKDIWAMEDRPAHMRKKGGIKDMSITDIIQYKEHYEKEAEKRGVGGAIFGKDSKLKAKVFKQQKDNGYNKLHKARWERLPMSTPKKYWKKVPKKREDIFRHLHLEHYGAEGLVNEATLVRLHDR